MIILISSDNFYEIYKSYPNYKSLSETIRIGVYPARTINETGSNVGPVVEARWHCFRCDLVSVVGLSGGLLRGRVRLLTEISFEQA